MEELCRAGKAHTRDNPERGELDPTEDVCRRCKLEVVTMVVVLRVTMLVCCLIVSLASKL